MAVRRSGSSLPARWRHGGGRATSTLVCLLVLGRLLIWSPSHARADEASEARAAFERGVEASEAGDWAAANVAFALSCERLPKASSLFNLALSQVRLGQGAQALESLDAFDGLAREDLHAHLMERARGLRLEAQSLADRARLQQLEQALLVRRAQEATEASPVPRSTGSAPPRDERRQWTVLGAGVGLSLGAVGAGLWWRERADERRRCLPDDGPTCREQAQITRQHRAAIGTSITLAVASAALVTVASISLRTSQRERRRADLSFGIGGVSLRARY